MFYARYKNSRGIMTDSLFNNDDFSLFFSTTSNPDCEIHAILDFTIRGKSYLEKKSNLETIAIDWSMLVCESRLSYGEMTIINDYFRTNGKRYGLYEEFLENGLF